MLKPANKFLKQVLNEKRIYVPILLMRLNSIINYEEEKKKKKKMQYFLLLYFHIIQIRISLVNIS